jgi:two-component sensor histidine kinase
MRLFQTNRESHLTLSRLVFVCFFLVSYVFCRGQRDSAEVLHLTTQQGLPSNHIYSVVQDRYGYIWMATDNGVVKYNGYNSKVFTTANGLPANDVWKLVEDKRGRLWTFAHANDIGYIEEDKPHLLNVSNGRFVITRALACNDSVSVVSYLQHGVPHMAVVGDSLTQIISFYDMKRFGNVMGYQLDRDFTLYGFGYDSTIWCFNPLKDQPADIYRCRFNYSIFSIFHYETNHIPVGNKLISYSKESNVLYILDMPTCRYFKVPLSPGDPDDKIVICEEAANGLTAVTGKAVYRLKFDPDLEIQKYAIPGFLRNTVSYSLTDRGSNSWYTTFKNGVWLSPPDGNRLSIERLEDLDGARLVGSVKGKVFWWIEKSQTLVTTENSNEVKRVSIPGFGSLSSVTEGQGKNVVLMFLKTLYSYDPETGEGHHLLPADGRLTISGYYLSSKGLYAEEVDDSVVFHYFAGSNRLSRISDSLFVIFGKMITSSLYLDSFKTHALLLIKDRTTNSIRSKDGQLTALFGPRNIYVFNSHFRLLFKMDAEYLQMIGLKDIVNIVSDGYGNYYIHCSDRIVRFNPASCRLDRLQTNFDLNSSKIFVFKDNLLVIGSFGVAHATIYRNGPISGFSILPNLNDRFFSKIIDCEIDLNGRIYLVTERGCGSFSIDSLQSSLHFPVTGAGILDLVLKKPSMRRIRHNDTILMSQHERLLSFDAINYFGRGDVQYYFRANGGDWQSNSSGDIYLEDLQAGEYYKVEYYAKDEHWNCDTKVLYVYQPLRWYQTAFWRTMFIGLSFVIFVVILLVVILLTQRYVTRMNEKRRIQTELELRAIHSQINPHFIFNTLSTALFFISKQKNEQAYDHVSKFSKLLRSYLKSSRERLISVAEEIEMLKQYIDLQRTRFQRSFHYEISVHPDLNPKNIIIPSLLLQPFVENAINHGLIHEVDDGRLLISFDKGTGGREIICRIDDNGIGRQKAGEMQSDSNMERSSYGNALTGELRDLFRKYEQMDIDMEYVDKQPPDHGTVVTLTIKGYKTVWQ